VDTWKLPQISLFTWTGADGDEVEGILELPPGYKPDDGPLPLITELHGGPTASTRYRLRLWIYGRALMPAKGYALFSPNYHGSTGYGDAFTSKLIGRENEIEVTDIRTGIEALIAQGIVNPEKIGVMGWSNGGFLTNAMITSCPDLFKAASSGAGVLDQALQWAIEDTPGHVINYMQGLPWENPEAYIKGSPLYKLGRVKTPTLIHVGGSDPRVPPAHSRALYRALKHYVKVPVELVVYPGEAHGLSTHENRLAKMKWDLAWFDKYLK
jgi:dipeptidyl aminopeptidase/acylaminoacyl peptidase